MNAKEIVSNYYKSDAVTNPQTIEKYLHNDALLNWHSSKGFLQLDKEGIIELLSGMSNSYASARICVHDILCEDDKVSVRYTHYVNPIESPSEEMVLAKFMSFWEIKDDKLHTGHLMSQLA